MANSKLDQTIDSLQRKHKNDGPDAVRQVYDDWAKTYDDDLETMGYVAPSNSVKQLLEAQLDPTALILDARCGTGLVGHYLQQQMFTRLHGIDYSPEMLDEARESGNYAWLGIADLTKPVQLADNHYDAVLCVGVMGPRLGADPLVSELVRVAKPGGLILIVIREEWHAEVLEPAVAQLADQNLATVVQSVTLPYFVEKKIAGRYVTLQKAE
ncbi:MAG: class I SAM-dependent methyltransferase [Chloroflexota bacterium]